MSANMSKITANAENEGMNSFRNDQRWLLSRIQLYQACRILESSIHKKCFRDICNDIDFLSTPEKGLKNLITKHQIMTERKENKLLS